MLAFSGTFLWLVALSAGGTAILYAGMCASLIRLRKLRPNAVALRIPFGPVLSILSIAICLALMTGLKRRELRLMCVTALIAGANWLWTRRHQLEPETKVKSGDSAVISSVTAPRRYNGEST